MVQSRPVWACIAQHPVSNIQADKSGRAKSDVYVVNCSRLSSSLQTADVFPVVASLPPKNNVCEPQRQNDFREVELF